CLTGRVPMNRRLAFFALAIAVTCVGFAFGQTPPLIGTLQLGTGQGATLTTQVPFLSGNRLRFWASPTGLQGSLPPGVTMTPTYLEPGSNQLSLHFEAALRVQTIANYDVYVYAGSSVTAAYRVRLSVVVPTSQPCGVPVLNPLDQSSQAVVVS